MWAMFADINHPQAEGQLQLKVLVIILKAVFPPSLYCTLRELRQRLSYQK